jgi:hypothetical protein
MCNGAASCFFGTQMDQRASGHELQRLFLKTPSRESSGYGVRRVLTAPGLIKCPFRVLRGVHLMHLGFGTSQFGLDGDP